LHVLAQGPHLLFIVGENILAFKINLTGSGFFQPQNGPAEGGFATPGFTDQAKRLTFPDAQADIFHGFNRSNFL